MSSRPRATGGLRHAAIFVYHFEACEHFYTELLGMHVEWRPDENNIYLTNGNDNLALHKVNEQFQPTEHQRLDHLGFIIDDLQDVDSWYEFLKDAGVSMKTAPRTHRDGARSFYCYDPDGTVIQMIFHPPLSLGAQKV